MYIAVKYCNMNDVIINGKYSMLTVIKEVDKFILPSGQPNRAYLCKCDCGKEKVIRKLHLVRGRTKSCGCFPRTRNGKSNHPIYVVYNSMRTRTKPNYFEKHLYYDKGIKMCEEWANDFFNFFKWAEENGYKKGLVIDRIDGNKNYSPDNCRFVTQLVNSNNRDCTFYVNYKGEKVSLRMLLRELNRNEDAYTIYTRIKRGMSLEMALEKPIRILKNSFRANKI